MATWTYESVIPSLIPNTIMQKVFKDGVHMIYTIQAMDGYVLHDKGRDVEQIDPDTMIVTGRIRGYTISETSCWNDYDFTKIQMEIDDVAIVTSYGERQFFAIPESNISNYEI